MRLLIDSSSICYASLYTTGGLSYGDQPTGIIYGFLSQILKLAQKFNTNKFIFCWDSRKSYRKLIYLEYKASRRKNLSPKELKDLKISFNQFTQLQEEILPKMGFANNFHQTGYEADDLISYVVARYPDQYMICSSDSDLWQLLYESRKCFVRTFDLRKKKVFGTNEFIKGWAIKPDQWAMAKAIAGDSSDNIKGIEKIGLLSAARYLNDTLDKKKKQRIDSEEGQKIIRRNMELIALPFAGIREIQIGRIKNKEKFYSLDFKDVFNEYGFTSFLSKGRFDVWRKAFGLISGRK